MMNASGKKWAFIAAIVLSFVLAQFQGEINPYFLQIIIYVGINTILASSLNLINGFTGQFSLGHAGFMSLGAYTASMITITFQATPGATSSYVMFPVALLVGGIVAAVAGVLVGIPSLRLKGDYLAITTLGLGEIIRVIIQNLDFVGGARGLVGIPKLSDFFWVFSVVAIVIFMISNMIHSTYGKGFLAVRDDEVAAQAMGINTTKYKVIAFVIGAFFAGVAGGLYAHFVSYITPSQFGFIKSIEIVVMVIVGGMGNTVGVILAAIVLTILPEALRGVAEYRMVLYSLMLVVIMISRPQGLFGTGFKRFFKKQAA
ncbi:MAG TPA: branched-chain amino acid ABC transporter permease [Bacteroidota bacterium]|jgi:branched-chain amino acid transport system permease protein|nr:branched-chain amino acid ABC transporter permease [Bacteroidota bacterium]